MKVIICTGLLIILIFIMASFERLDKINKTLDKINKTLDKIIIKMELFERGGFMSEAGKVGDEVLVYGVIKEIISTEDGDIVYLVKFKNGVDRSYINYEFARVHWSAISENITNNLDHQYEIEKANAGKE